MQCVCCSNVDRYLSRKDKFTIMKYEKLNIIENNGCYSVDSNKIVIVTRKYIFGLICLSSQGKNNVCGNIQMKEYNKLCI